MRRGIVEAEGAEVVHAEDVVGVAVGVEDGVDAADVLADGLGVEVGAGVDDDVAAVRSEMRTEGRVRRLRGSPRAMTAERQTAQSQPSVGTPIEVPLPRKVRVASM